MDKEEIEKKIMQMRQKLQILQWDADKDQINPAKRFQLEQMKKEYEDLKNQLKEAEAKEPEDKVPEKKEEESEPAAEEVPAVEEPVEEAEEAPAEEPAPEESKEEEKPETNEA